MEISETLHLQESDTEKVKCLINNPYKYQGCWSPLTKLADWFYNQPKFTDLTIIQNRIQRLQWVEFCLSNTPKKIKSHKNVVDKDKNTIQAFAFFLCSIWLFIACCRMHKNVIRKTKFVIFQHLLHLSWFPWNMIGRLNSMTQIPPRDLHYTAL